MARTPAKSPVKLSWKKTGTRSLPTQKVCCLRRCLMKLRLLASSCSAPQRAFFIRSRAKREQTQSKA
eukprot:6195511-Pleurochrysis_carterae.AAC.2